MVMSVKTLQSEGIVLPISGKLCQACKASYDALYTSKPGEKIVIIMPRAQLPMTSPLTIPSPFCRPTSPQKNNCNVVELCNDSKPAVLNLQNYQYPVNLNSTQGSHHTGTTLSISMVIQTILLHSFLFIVINL